ncbi:ras-related protein Rap-2a [Folsomia candida]|uniref:ras-related protein Rap-2a n=1 Tax=Folsomia candida TaxID=158441 RepID=UPI000B8FCF3E|nr:ras-related protein Rap-2a [Folsomia candida]
MIPSRLQRSDTAAMSQTPPRPRTGRRLSLQPQPSLQPSLSPPSSRFRRSPSPTPPKARTTASTPTKGPSKLGYKVMMLGSARVGKTAIIQRFLYDTWTGKYRRTVEEMHRADFPIGGASLTLDILDTSGSYEFPAMKTLNIASSNAFIIVYAVDDDTSFDEMLTLRNQVVQSKGDGIPLVVVGNKTDLDSEEHRVDENQAQKVVNRWNHGFVLCSAKTGDRVTDVFKELLTQAKVTYRLSPALRKRRQSLPGGVASASASTSVAPPVHVPTPQQLAALRDRHSKRNSCIIS